jgi:hypothetical protein
LTPLGPARIVGAISNNAGNLLWNRQSITLQAGVPTDIDTGLTQVQQDFSQSSVNEPFLGIPGTAAPGPGALPASRVQVIPLAPLAGWQFVTHSEPYFNTSTGTVHVAFTFNGEGATTLNALFWDPDTKIGPGQAVPYNAAPPPGGAPAAKPVK